MAEPPPQARSCFRRLNLYTVTLANASFGVGVAAVFSPASLGLSVPHTSPLAFACRCL